MATTQPIRNKHQIRELAAYYLRRGQTRNHLLVVLGVHTALRIGDLLRLTWDDVYDFDTRRLRESVSVTERKTGKTKQLALNDAVLTALRFRLCVARSGEFLFRSRKGGAIGRVQAYRLIRAAAEALGFRARVSCHSLRKTFGYHAWKSGVSPAVIMEIYNHSSFAVTRRYLGVTRDDTDAAYRILADVI